MILEGNTIFITGGGSGIGRALAEAFHERGNQVIISGRHRSRLDETTNANPGMHAVELDITDPLSIREAATTLIAEFPKVNVLLNNAGVMLIDDISEPVDETLLVSTVATNLLGPIRMTSALIEHLKKQDHATVINVSSVLGFVPMSITGVYSATKAAIHSYSMSLRYKLSHSPVKVLEIIPPWVQTDLLNSRNEPQAMPLQEFIKETMMVLGSEATEVLVAQAKPMRSNPGPDESGFVTGFNDEVSRLRGLTRES